jgi:hypothetical protein
METRQASDKETPADTPAPAPVAPISAPAPGFGRTELGMLAAGVIGGAVLFLALLSARSAAAPEAATPAEDAPATAVTSPAAPAARAGAPDTTPDAVPVSAGRRDVIAGWIPNPAWVGHARQSVAFELAANNDVQVWLRTVRPVLIVRCMDKTTEAFVFTDSAAKMELQDEDHTVRVAFDDEPLSTERWPDSQEHDALFARDGAAFARRLLQAHTLQFGFTPHNAAPVVAKFSVTGLGPLMEHATKQCGQARKRS